MSMCIAVLHRMVLFLWLLPFFVGQFFWDGVSIDVDAQLLHVPSHPPVPVEKACWWSAVLDVGLFQQPGSWHWHCGRNLEGLHCVWSSSYCWTVMSLLPLLGQLGQPDYQHFKFWSVLLIHLVYLLFFFSFDGYSQCNLNEKNWLANFSHEIVYFVLSSMVKFPYKYYGTDLYRCSIILPVFPFLPVVGRGRCLAVATSPSSVCCYCKFWDFTIN